MNPPKQKKATAYSCRDILKSCFTFFGLLMVVLLCPACENREGCADAWNVFFYDAQQDSVPIRLIEICDEDGQCMSSTSVWTPCPDAPTTYCGAFEGSECLPPGSYTYSYYASETGGAPEGSGVFTLPVFVSQYSARFGCRVRIFIEGGAMDNTENCSGCQFLSCAGEGNGNPSSAGSSTAAESLDNESPTTP